ncbi:hypothetical protein GWI33_015503 [Rhynchophorus ferrugineus]|uniref:Uncharacterized protein n=1 Tax=Rhynchophorus ferrugineus TaxID=354439 RepID=A0A834I2F7_RHYFE|nr:hypothetical protein GWI33_015503 [Rhynchophorus ferrugineus]
MVITILLYFNQSVLLLKRNWQQCQNCYSHSALSILFSAFTLLLRNLLHEKVSLSLLENETVVFRIVSNSVSNIKSKSR